ncbi:S-adenosyl-L-methionine-dependent methyltransferase [Gilbertella persicaria]|uniref:S-adenosyl-L-methionine-dependent methyltransferase n=1 Tax=Gilbertella persicaria TaxID=101096 RepID=UPI00221F7EE0|nr:S-adenosyl-L-methionine-dependent methyltransferase [Gilbertella persicaria]KAI8059023.1 S-adenosyl-L-methionine-dependent methyltransferase [Gilbertella persicaria]
MHKYITEEWTYKVIDQLRQHHLDKLKSPLRILDICTGSGCIALALAKHLPKGTVHITGLDISNKAIALAKENLQVHQHVLLNPVEFVQQDIFEFNLPQDTFNFIVSNPPYVTLDEYDSLDPDVKSWEDVGALVAEDQGTRVHQRIIQMTTAISPMLSMPYLYMEIGGTHQVGLLNEAMRKHGFKGTKVWKDLADKDRVIVGY